MITTALEGVHVNIDTDFVVISEVTQKLLMILYGQDGGDGDGDDQ